MKTVGTRRGYRHPPNDYQRAIGYWDQVPKAVFAAVAVSVLTVGGDHLDKAESRFAREWWALYTAGIVPQRPCVPDPGGDVE
jgi:hypothetical protein